MVHRVGFTIEIKRLQESTLIILFSGSLKTISLFCLTDFNIELPMTTFCLNLGILFLGPFTVIKVEYIQFQFSEIKDLPLSEVKNC